MDFGLMFFSSKSDDSGEKYKLLLEAARFADAHDFCAVWTPERHFDRFGGIFPNPSVVSAALAMITRRLQIRAGSVISPLHNPLRIVEEWAVVDNLSNGRVGLSFGSGWHVNDFVFFPERYRERQRVMYEQIETIWQLWQGGRITQQNPYNHEVELTLHPKPLQATLPTWVTSAGNRETFLSAGKIGANLLTHLVHQDINTLAANICSYRDVYKKHHPTAAAGKVSLMLHTFLGETMEQVAVKVREPLRDYLRISLQLANRDAQGGGAYHGGLQSAEMEQVDDAMVEELLELTYERYVQHSSLIGTVDSCMAMIQQCKVIGVDEIACLIDFGVEFEAVMASLPYLDQLRMRFSTA